MRIPFVNIIDQNRQLEKYFIDNLHKLIASGMYILGQSVIDFENRFAEYCGTKYAVGVNSGTDALIFALKALDIGPGDEVITVPNSFIATASSIIACGAKPIFVDVGLDYNIDGRLVKNAITKKTKAILPVHLTGRPAEMKTLFELAALYQLPIIEDAAQAVGAEWHGKKVGSLGNIGCFSLHPLKVLGGLGDGGILTTDDKNIYDRLQKLRNFGLEGRNSVLTWGTNSRLDALQAAFLQVKINFLDQWIDERRRIASEYRQRLKNIVQIPEEESNLKAVYQTFIIQAEFRDELAIFLQKKSIETKVHYPVPLHLQPLIKKVVGEIKTCVNAEKMSNKILSLPIYPEISSDAVDYIVTSIKEFYG